MPPQLNSTPMSLEQQCIYAYLNYLYGEMSLIFQLKQFQDRSLIIKKHGLNPDYLLERFSVQLSHCLKGILQDIVRQKMVDILIGSLQLICDDLTDVSANASLNRTINFRPNTGRPHDFTMTNPQIQNGQPSTSDANQAAVAGSQTRMTSDFLRSLPLFQLFSLILHKDLEQLDFSQNNSWVESEEMQEVTRIIWKIISEKCTRLKKLIIPKELAYSNNVNGIIMNGKNLTTLTLKRNVPNNMFLSLVGQNCPNIRELDIAGADIVTDFGVVCLLFDDPEQIFCECWNREKTVGTGRRSFRCFPHPHFDKPIPDPTDVPPTTKVANQFLHLKKNFHDAIRADQGSTHERLPICNSLRKFRLENTKVKSDGASVVLECCPNLYSLGYLVFAAAGLKQVYGYEDPHETKFTEIFYRGPSDQKLQTISNCCPKLRMMFLGSNSVRRLNTTVFMRWEHLEYLTLENIHSDDVTSCLEVIGKQLKGLKLQCSGFDLADVAINCPNLVSLVIQREAPVPHLSSRKLSKANKFFQQLLHVEVSCTLSKNCFGFILSHAHQLKSIKVLSVSGFKKEDFEQWSSNLPKLETLIIFRAVDINREMAESIIENLPNIKLFGDFHSFELKRPNEMKRIQGRVRDENWDLRLVDSQAMITDEKDFNKQLSLHWFYLTNKNEK